MTDRELLNLAAKAAGIPLLWHNFSKVPSVFKGLSSDEVWDPRTDSGQALELAVKLPMRAVIDEVWVTERTSIAEWERDPLAATRLAITRAAAEIGKAMP